MRLVTLDSREVGGRPAVWLPSGDLLDLAAPASGLSASQWRPMSVVSVLAEGDEGRARVAKLSAEIDNATSGQRAEWKRSGRLLPLEGTELLTPVRRPGLVLITRSAAALRSFVKNPNSVAGPDAAVRVPGGREGELFAVPLIGLVLGRSLYRGTPEQSLRALAALTLGVDLGTRPLSDSSEVNRQFPGACPIGPAILTLDECPEASVPAPVFRINGDKVGSTTAGATFAELGRLLASLSEAYAFRPGDIVGVASGITEHRVRAGDRLSVALGSLLELRFSLSE